MNLEQAREVLINHSRSDLNGKFPPTITHETQLTNPWCGDYVQIKLFIQGGYITEIGFHAKACAICSASTSLMSGFIRGQTIQHAHFIATEFENSILASAEEAWPLLLAPLKSFEHLKINHARRACAILPWVAFRSAVKETK